MLTIWCGGGNSLRETWVVLLKLCLEYVLEFSETYISAGVVFFGTLGGKIEAKIDEMRLQ